MSKTYATAQSACTPTAESGGSAPNRTDRIRQCLSSQFKPQHLRVANRSEDHRGHVGWRKHGETHFHVDLVSATFVGLDPVRRHRSVMSALSSEFGEGKLHALSLRLLTPEEWARQKMTGGNGDEGVRNR